MNNSDIRRAALSLRAKRSAALRAESKLVDTLKIFCDQTSGNMVGLAGHLGISTPYMSDVRRGKRNVSEQLIDKMVKL